MTINKAPNPTSKLAISLYRNLQVYVLVILQFAPLFYALITGRIGTSLDPSSVEAQTDSSSSIVWQIIAVTILFNSLFLARLSRISIQTFLFAILPVLPMLCWICSSVIWSHYPDLTIRRSLRALVEITTIVLLAVSFSDPRELLRTLFKGFFIINLVDLASLAVPALSFTEIGFAGVHLHKNTAGLFFFLALPVFACGMIDRNISRLRSAAVFALVTAGGMLILTLSKTAIGVIIISIVLAGLGRIIAKRNPFSRVVLPAICTLCVSSAVALVLEYGVSDTFRFVFGDATLTGRVPMWHYAIYMFDRDPVQGVGYGALWQVGSDVQEMLKYASVTWVANEAHNGYLDLLAQLGIVGLGLLIAFLVLAARRIFRYAQLFEQNKIIGLRDYALYVLLGALLYNGTESSFFRSGHGLWFMLVFVSAFVARMLSKGAAVVYEPSRRVSYKKTIRI